MPTETTRDQTSDHAAAAFQMSAELERMREVFWTIKRHALNAGAPGELTVPRALSRIVRLCIDAGAKE